MNSSNWALATMRTRTLLMGLLSMVQPVTAADMGCDQSIPPAPEAVDFDQQIQPIFDQYCVACHSEGTAAFEESGLDLRPGRAHASLYRQPSVPEPDRRLVEPYADGVSKSVLWGKLNCSNPSSGGRMPLGQTPLTFEQRFQVYSWIYRGAPPGESGTGRRASISFSHSGSWIDPTAPGQGLVLEVLDGEVKKVILYWMTYRKENFTAGENYTAFDASRWMVGVGDYAPGDDRAVLQISSGLGGRFDELLPNPVNVTLGTAILQFHSCNEATLTYDINRDGDIARRTSRSMALIRLTPSPNCS